MSLDQRERTHGDGSCQRIVERRVPVEKQSRPYLVIGVASLKSALAANHTWSKSRDFTSPPTHRNARKPLSIAAAKTQSQLEGAAAAQEAPGSPTSVPDFEPIVQSSSRCVAAKPGRPDTKESRLDP